ncbi:metallophosphoesterase [Bacillus sp. FJAT-29814]|uniref:metallophosphoesterase n=1 Tax=Bacillus sp. FJAT-29814 TaxID=1729688 RepID=UPI00082C57F0|nr:metallophosphoesterase [Bacillus sp. FJAT-29814]
MRRIAISDIHGCAAELDKLLEKTKALASEVIFLGDYVDTGSNSLDVVERVSEWCSQGAIALLGNHDDLFLRWLEGKEIIYFYGKTGGIATINSFLDRIGLEPVEYTQLLHDENKENDIRKKIQDHFQPQISFLQSCPLFKQESDFIFVHAGINPKKGLEKTTRTEFLHLRDEFIYEYNGQETVVFGHTPTRRLHKSNEVYFGSNRVIGIDGGCAFGGQLNALIINDDEFSTEAVLKTF